MKNKNGEKELLIITPPEINKEIGKLIGDLFYEYGSELGAIIITKAGLSKKHLNRLEKGELKIIEIKTGKNGQSKTSSHSVIFFVDPIRSHAGCL